MTLSDTSEHLPVKLFKPSTPVLGELRDSFAVLLTQDARMEADLWAHTRPDPFKG